METSNNNKTNSKINKEQSEGNGFSRRSLLKAFAGLPVLGILGWRTTKNYNYLKDKRTKLLKELELDKLQIPSIKPAVKGNLLKIGFIGFGNRSRQLARSLGYLHPDQVKQMETNGTLSAYLEQEDLNIAIVGICDVFDLNAEYGMEIANNPVRVGGVKDESLKVKRYRTYRELLDDKNIDAVVIATPDHHHARFSTEAIKAGKHVYCEKSPALELDELNELYDTVKGSDRIYQLGHQVPQNVIFQQAKEIVEKGILGKISLIETTTNRNTSSGAWIRHLDNNGNPKPGDEKSIDWLQWLGHTPYQPFSIDRFYNWTKWFAYDHGMIGQLFTHEFDSVNQLLKIGIPKTASSSGGIYYWKDNREMPDVITCIMEYPNHDLTLTYSGTLANSRSRGRVFMGSDASMELGNSIQIIADANSTRYKDKLAAGIINSREPMISIQPGTGAIDAVSTATDKYYAARGLTTTTINGKQVDVTHLHMKDWIDAIRTNSAPTANIEMAYQEGVTCLMAHLSYIYKRQVEWDPVNRKIV